MADNPNSTDKERKTTLAVALTPADRMSLRIRDQGPQLRDESKKWADTVSGDTSSASTRKQRKVFADNWETFYTAVLENSIERIPTGEDILRYIGSVPGLSEKRQGREAISVSYLKARLAATLDAVRKRHDSFELTYLEDKKITSAIEDLETAGLITREPLREQQWISSHLMVCLNRGHLVDAIKHGTTNWSIVMQKCLSLALQSALSSRCGNITVSADCSEDAHLKFECIKLKVVPLGEAHDASVPLFDRVKLVADITLKYTKGKKNDPSRNHRVKLESLDDPKFNTGDSLKLLLGHALRFGNVKDAVSLDDAIRNALSREDNLIIWAYPKRPVLSAAIHNKLDIDRPARTQSICNALKGACILSGISEKLQSHDLRRGAARENALLTPRFNLRQAGEALDHRPSDYGTVTRKYVGGEVVPNIRERMQLKDHDMFHITDVKIPGVDTPFVPPSTAPGASTKRRRLMQGEVDAYLADPENSHLFESAPRDTRHAAVMRLNEQRNFGGYKSSATPDADDKIADFELDDDIVRLAQFPSANNVSALTDLDEEDNDVDYSSVENGARRVAEVLELLNEEEADVTQQHRLTAAQVEMQVLTSTPSSFVEWLSRKNTRVSNDTNPRQHENLERFGSMDEPSLFVHHCKFEVDGCIATSNSFPVMNKHEASCTAASRAKAEAKRELIDNANFTTACTVSDCKWVGHADTRRQLKERVRRHQDSVHPPRLEQPLHCEVGGVASCKQPFWTQRAYSRHVNEYHSGSVPVMCPLYGQDRCRSKKMWKNRSQLYDHLRNLHPDQGKDRLTEVLNKAMEVMNGERPAESEPPIGDGSKGSSSAKGIEDENSTDSVNDNNESLHQHAKGKAVVGGAVDDTLASAFGAVTNDEESEDDGMLAIRRAQAKKQRVIVVDDDEDDVEHSSAVLTQDPGENATTDSNPAGASHYCKCCRRDCKTARGLRSHLNTKGHNLAVKKAEKTAMYMADFNRRMSQRSETAMPSATEAASQQATSKKRAAVMSDDEAEDASISSFNRVHKKATGAGNFDNGSLAYNDKTVVTESDENRDDGAIGPIAVDSD